jgi:hypothetical protein
LIIVLSCMLWFYTSAGDLMHTNNAAYMSLFSTTDNSQIGRSVRGSKVSSFYFKVHLFHIFLQFCESLYVSLKAWSMTDTPCGLDGYSYAMRDKTSKKITHSRPWPYSPFSSGDVIGPYISLPPLHPPSRSRRDPHELANIKRECITIELKGQEYFKSLEYVQSKEMLTLMYVSRKPVDGSSVPPTTKKPATVENVPERGTEGSGSGSGLACLYKCYSSMANCRTSLHRQQAPLFRFLSNHQCYDRLTSLQPAAPQTSSRTRNYHCRHHLKKLQLVHWPITLVVHHACPLFPSVCELSNAQT